eukprot:scaffold3049_cov122-Skeletonema_dohrnii-CCMP3373.AAC.8
MTLENPLIAIFSHNITTRKIQTASCVTYPRQSTSWSNMAGGTLMRHLCTIYPATIMGFWTSNPLQF